MSNIKNNFKHEADALQELEFKKAPQIISLFCGAGGLDIGFEQAGFKTVAAFDYNKAAVETHNYNSSKNVATVADLSVISSLDIAKHIRAICADAAPVGVVGGPPCQGFSKANTNSNSNDPRNKLVKNYAEIVIGLCDLYPIKFFVFENVPNITSKKNKTNLDEIVSLLSTKFNIYKQVINALNFGLAQSRERFILVGIRREIESNGFSFPDPVPGRGLTVHDVISGLPAATFYQRNISPNEIEYHQNHWTMRPKSKKFGPDLKPSGRSFIRLSWDKPSRTVAYGHREIHVHPSGLRRLTIYEAMLLQGFPKDYVLLGNLSEQVTQVSNAVPPPVGRAIANSILKSIV